MFFRIFIKPEQFFHCHHLFRLPVYHNAPIVFSSCLKVALMPEICPEKKTESNTSVGLISSTGPLFSLAILLKADNMCPELAEYMFTSATWIIFRTASFEMYFGFDIG